MSTPSWWGSDKPARICDWCAGLKSLPDGVVDMGVTSPPYWGLRDYQVEPVIFDDEPGCEHVWGDDAGYKGHRGNRGQVPQSKWKKYDFYPQNNKSIQNLCVKCGAWRGQLGLEPTSEMFIQHLCDGFDEFIRVLKDTGSLYVNLGDSYSTGGGSGAGDYRENRHTQFGKNVSKEGQSLPHSDRNFPDKSLCLIPARFAHEMIRRGWVLRNTIIWYKPSCLPSSADDRYTLDHEYIFFFVKSTETKYWYNVNTMSCVNTKPPGTADGKQDVDWYWKTMPDGTRKKTSYWKGRDYFFNQQFEPFADDANTNEVYTGTSLKDYAKNKAQDPSDTKRRVLESMKTRIGRNKRTVWHVDDDFITYLLNMLGPEKFNELVEDYNGMDMNMSSIFSVCTSSYKGSHCAVYPPALIEPIIDAGTPEFICNACGLPRNRVYNFESMTKGPVRDNHQPTGRSHFRIAGTFISNKELKGYTDCGCNAGFRPGIVLDPFLGSGTTLEVARNMGRLGLGFELNPAYYGLIDKRAMLKMPFLESYDGVN